MNTEAEGRAERQFLMDRYVFDRHERGRSSDALVRYALDPNSADLTAVSFFPDDFGDLARCFEAYKAAPLHLRKRMRPLLAKFCAHVAERETEAIARYGNR